MLNNPAICSARGVLLAHGGQRHYFATRKTPLNTSLFYIVLLMVCSQGVRNFCTPSAAGPYRSVSTAFCFKRCFSTSWQAFVAHGASAISLWQGG